MNSGLAWIIYKIIGWYPRFDPKRRVYLWVRHGN